MNGGKGDEREDNTIDESERVNNDDLYIYKEREIKIETTTRGVNLPFMYECIHKKTITIAPTKTG